MKAQKARLVVSNEGNYFFHQIRRTIKNLRATLEMLEDMGAEADMDEETKVQSEAELKEIAELITYWEAVLNDNNQPLE